MTDKKQVISQTRNKKAGNEAGKKRTKKQKENRGVEASFLTLENVKILEKPEELLSMIDNLIIKYQNKGEEMERKIKQKAGVITYEMMEKNLCLSIARHVEKAFKHYHPQVKILNPKDNVFYRIVVKFKSR